MTRVCLVADDDSSLPVDLYGYDTARRALGTYDITEPWDNTVVLDTVSLGAAVSLLNDLNWYLARLTSDAFVRDPSVSRHEWLSRPLAREIRDGTVSPDDPINRLKVYGVENGRLVDPTHVLRGSGGDGDYERSEYEDTVVVRVTQDEFF
ncbi:DUF5804 family protein [Salarchaeum sp. JOR-1]|uniref:DUF5804 family protein n=1 Tax=Salarchaeum sp. JOR-1 TaxID=2599399 RepID=UPI001198AE00|nr:DUF5804 family protein [Salarchaeum sp. JOR-1]QDX41636.1 hypothetical protein FQU85_12240 [Salarchaeum sp. JOR-1]